jgi:hypothetical protein
MSHWYNSIVFSDDWFGEVPPTGGPLTRGRFAYTRVRDGITVRGQWFALVFHELAIVRRTRMKCTIPSVSYVPRGI